jgi:hypothetical protein
MKRGKDLMKTKTWKVMTTTGKQADLESGLEKKEIQKPAHISARDFVHWLAAESHIDDNSIAFAIQAVRTPARERVPPSATRKFPLPDSFAAGDHPLEQAHCSSFFAGTSSARLTLLHTIGNPGLQLFDRDR